MVLCVSEIRWAEASDTDTLKEDEEPLLVIVGLELTDGWYRIRAAMDGTLRSAVERGKICLGCKLTVIGARVRFNQGREREGELTRGDF
jgi:breast cancer 2 susceptibility protein